MDLSVTHPHVHNDTISCLDKLAISIEKSIHGGTLKNYLMRTEHVSGQGMLTMGEENTVMEN